MRPRARLELRSDDAVIMAARFDHFAAADVNADVPVKKDQHARQIRHRADPAALDAALPHPVRAHVLLRAVVRRGIRPLAPEIALDQPHAVVHAAAELIGKPQLIAALIIILRILLLLDGQQRARGGVAEGPVPIGPAELRFGVGDQAGICFLHDVLPFLLKRSLHPIGETPPKRSAQRLIPAPRA